MPRRSKVIYEVKVGGVWRPIPPKSKPRVLRTGWLELLSTDGTTRYSAHFDPKHWRKKEEDNG